MTDTDNALQLEIAELIVSALNLEQAPADITPDAALFGDGNGDGLGLDSIDILEVALVISKRYGFQLRADSDDNVRIFSSLRALATHVAQNRSK